MLQREGRRPQEWGKQVKVEGKQRDSGRAKHRCREFGTKMNRPIPARVVAQVKLEEELQQ